MNHLYWYQITLFLAKLYKIVIANNKLFMNTYVIVVGQRYYYKYCDCQDLV